MSEHATAHAPPPLGKMNAVSLGRAASSASISFSSSEVWCGANAALVSLESVAVPVGVAMAAPQSKSRDCTFRRELASAASAAAPSAVGAAAPSACASAIPMALFSSSVAPSASKCWSFFDRRSPVNRELLPPSPVRVYSTDFLWARVAVAKPAASVDGPRVPPAALAADARAAVTDSAATWWDAIKRAGTRSRERLASIVLGCLHHVAADAIPTSFIPRPPLLLVRRKFETLAHYICHLSELRIAEAICELGGGIGMGIGDGEFLRRGLGEAIEGQGEALA